ncbi:hypothetical protein Pla22_31080 [Rubripirellula amarantea]|uniref:Uncharacterized protein n=1 Tax=Rubripirellula amarantea TaxID=2527999 RepID=A0A5C5WHT9_9BACT|nr:hypothetical protein Pla22_31080 [Rubripirellula amarantea]
MAAQIRLFGMRRVAISSWLIFISRLIKSHDVAMLRQSRFQARPCPRVRALMDQRVAACVSPRACRGVRVAACVTAAHGNWGSELGPRKKPGEWSHRALNVLLRIA